MSLLHVISITLDIYGIVLSLALVWGLYRGSSKKKKLNQIFIWMCWFNIGTLLGDIPNWTCEGNDYLWQILGLRGGCLLLYLCGLFLLMAYTRYVAAYLEAKITVSNIYLNTVNAIGAVYLLGVLLSQYNGMFYGFDSTNHYYRGKWYIWSQVLVVFILLVDTFMILKYRKYLRGKEVAAFSGYIVFPIIAVIIQFFCYGLSLTYTASTVALLVIYIDIQSEQAFLIEQMEHQLLQGRLSMLLSQIKPHFLYNSLTAIANLCSTDPRTAKEELINFARYLQSNMNSLTKEAPIPLKEELEHTKFYLSIEKLRFEERLNVIYQIQAWMFSIPPLVLQPIVENAVRHGIMHRDSGGTIIISTKETKEEWIVMVEDDGPGFDMEDDSLCDGVHHVGIYNVRQRLSYLCGGTLEIISRKNQGTRVMIRIPRRSSI